MGYLRRSKNTEKDTCLTTMIAGELQSLIDNHW